MLRVRAWWGRRAGQRRGQWWGRSAGRGCGSVLSYVLAFFAGLVNATGNVLNRKAARDEPDQAEFRLRLITDLMHRKVWLAAVGMMIISFALATAALGTGQLASVQLVVVLELPMTIIGGALLLRTPLDRREWVAIGILTAGVIGLLALLDPQAGQAKPIPAILWIAMSAANAGALVTLVLIARTHPRPAVRASLLGIATGLGYGLTAAYTKGFADQFSKGGVSAVLELLAVLCVRHGGSGLGVPAGERVSGGTADGIPARNHPGGSAYLHHLGHRRFRRDHQSRCPARANRLAGDSGGRRSTPAQPVPSAASHANRRGCPGNGYRRRQSHPIVTQGVGVSGPRRKFAGPAPGRRRSPDRNVVP